MKKFLTTIIFTFLFFGFSNKASASTNIYIGPESKGTGDGSSWDNMKVFPFGKSYDEWKNFWVRDAVYYLADGEYTGPFSNYFSGLILCNKPIEGNKTITIKKATTEDHGTKDGWQEDYGNGQAVITAVVPPSPNDANMFIVETNNWVFDGVKGEGNDPSSYGIRIQPTGTSLQAERMFDIFIPASNLTIRHIDMAHRGVDFGVKDVEVNYGASSIYFYDAESGGEYSTNNLIEYCYFHDSDSVFMHIGGVKNFTINHCYFARNETNGSPYDDHGVAIQTHARAGWDQTCGTQISNIGVYIKNSIFENIEGTGIMTISCGKDWYFYGNQVWFNNYPSIGQNRENSGGPIFITTGGTRYPSDNIFIFNNNIYNLIHPDVSLRDTNGNAGVQSIPPSTYYAFNNIWSNCSRIVSNGILDGQLSHNVYRSIGKFYNATDLANPINDEGKQILLPGQNPFVNQSQFDLHLSIATSAGVDPREIIQAHNGIILADYNIDPDGNLRGEDGVWDRGAYEFKSCQQGDIDCSGQVNSQDIQLAINVFLGIENDETKKTRVDLNDDKIIDVQDIQRIINIILGL